MANLSEFVIKNQDHQNGFKRFFENIIVYIHKNCASYVGFFLLLTLWHTNTHHKYLMFLCILSSFIKQRVLGSTWYWSGLCFNIVARSTECFNVDRLNVFIEHSLGWLMEDRAWFISQMPKVMLIFIQIMHFLCYI